MRLRAFSLTELLTVIAIMAILAAVAFPTYNNYTVKAKLVDSIIKINAILDAATIKFEKSGSYPSSLSVNGVTVPLDSWTVVNLGSIRHVYYQRTADGQAIQLLATIRGLTGIPNYIDPISGVSTSGRHNLAFAVRKFNGIHKTVCGHEWDPGGATWINREVPFAYLPNYCQCPYTASIRDGGDPTACL